MSDLSTANRNYLPYRSAGSAPNASQLGEDTLIDLAKSESFAACYPHTYEISTKTPNGSAGWSRMDNAISAFSINRSSNAGAPGIPTFITPDASLRQDAPLGALMVSYPSYDPTEQLGVFELEVEVDFRNPTIPGLQSANGQAFLGASQGVPSARVTEVTVLTGGETLIGMSSGRAWAYTGRDAMFPFTFSSEDGKGKMKLLYGKIPEQAVSVVLDCAGIHEDMSFSSKGGVVLHLPSVCEGVFSALVLQPFEDADGFVLFPDLGPEWSGTLRWLPDGVSPPEGGGFGSPIP